MYPRDGELCGATPCLWSIYLTVYNQVGNQTQTRSLQGKWNTSAPFCNPITLWFHKICWKKSSLRHYHFGLCEKKKFAEPWIEVDSLVEPFLMMYSKKRTEIPKVLSIFSAIISWKKTFQRPLVMKSTCQWTPVMIHGEHHHNDDYYNLFIGMKPSLTDVWMI